MDHLKLSPQDMSKMSTGEIFEISGALFSGHTEFYNGWHGNGWIEKGLIIRYPNILEEITKRQSEEIKKNFQADLIVGAAHNGAIIAGFNARHLNTLFAHTHGKGEEIKFQRMFSPPKGLTVCLVEDLIFSGTDISDHIKFFKKYGLIMSGVSVWINRQGDQTDGIKITSLTKHPFEIYKNDCPLCGEGVPLMYKNIRE